MKKFNFRIGNLEARSCDKQLLVSNGGEHNTAEIIKWFESDNSCYTIAYFKQGGDDNSDFDLEFIGGRPLEDDVCMIDFMRLAKNGYLQLMLNLAVAEREEE